MAEESLLHYPLICLYLLITTSASAQNSTNYYISQSGNDTNKGTRSKPFKTIERLNKEKLQPGSSVYLEGGTTFPGPLILEADESGTKAQPIKITSHGKGVATIDGNLKEAIIIKGSHFILSNINAKGAGRKEGNTTNGIYITSANNAVIENVTTEGFQKSGIEVNNARNIQLNKITARHNGFCGIFINGEITKSKNILIRNCMAEDNPGDPTILDNHSGNGILVGGSDSVLIDHCTATNNGWDMPRKGNGPVGIWGYASDHLLIQYCISYRNRTLAGAADGGGFDFDGGVTNSIIQYCLSYENEGSGYGIFQYDGATPWYNNIVRYCVSINDGKKTPGAGGFLIWNSSLKGDDFKSCQIYNNVVYNDSVAVIRFDANSTNKNFLFTNNIFIGKDDIVNGPSSGETFSGNCWWNIPQHSIKFRGCKSLAVWADSTGQEKLKGQLSGQQFDPLLKGPFTTSITDPYQLNMLEGFKLQEKSPLKGRGVDVASLYNIALPSTDFFGNSIKQTITGPGIHTSDK